jgi:type IV conjugative transfer system lipoprotein TraV
MKELMLLIPLGSALLLTGCAGTESDFECNATTSDTCMTMEQANEKAKARRKTRQQSRLRPGCHDWLTEISERRRQTHTRCRRSQ